MNYTSIPILMYHDIGEHDSPWCVSHSEFEKQMAFLHEQGYESISLAELEEGIRQNKEASKKFVVITFDDGRKSVYTLAFPVLQKYGYKATIFVVPQWIDGKEIPANENYSAFLSWEELEMLRDAGFELGSHSLSHKNLTKLPFTGMMGELNAAEKIISERLGVALRHFAYPYGEWNEPVKAEILQRYKTAVTVQRGFFKTPGRYARQGVLRGMSIDDFAALLIPQTISVCLIVKNEENMLPNCLQSVKDIAHEIIVVDTGSTDKTKEIARKHTDKIFDFTWNDDFASARNEYLNHAAGDWIFAIDADEVLAKDDQERIQEIVEGVSPQVVACKLVLRNYTNDARAAGWRPRGDDAYSESAEVSGWWEVSKIRLFRNKKGLRYSGRIHENLTESLPVGSKVLETAVPIHHYGKLYDDAQRRNEQKKEMYERLEKLKVEEKGGFYSYFELGRQYVHNGKLSEAVEALNQSIQCRGDYFESWFLLGSVLLMQENMEEARKALEKAKVLHSGYAPVYANLGIVYAQQKNFPLAMGAFQQALALNNKDATSWKNLGLCLEEMGQREKAEFCYEKGRKLNPN